MFTALFVAALLVTTVGRGWLSSRQVAHVAAHRAEVPARFAERVSLTAHQKAADYTIARTRLGMLESLIGTAVLVALTLLGGLQFIDDRVQAVLPGSSPLWRELALVGVVSVVFGLVDLPFSLYRQFRLEQRFGFNRMTLGLFVVDLVKGTVLGVVLGAPLLVAMLSLMHAASDLWWVYAWLVWIGFNGLLLWLFPTVIAPLFNKFQPLSDASLRTRIEGLLTRCGFASRGVFVMDGSKRSAHGNAYFTGFGAAKRIVFFDTLISRLTGDEIEAVLAHELGHFARRHIVKRIAWSFAMSLVALALLGWLAQQPWFYLGLGTDPTLGMRDVTALLLFFLVLPVFTFPLSPLSSLASRRHEFEADAYAAAQADAGDLIRALVKLYEDNASTLTPDPLHSRFYDSHPPAAVRIGRLEALSRGSRLESLAPNPPSDRSKNAMPLTVAELLASHCRPLEGGAASSEEAVSAQLGVLPEWQRDGKRIHRRYTFGDYWETIAFVNAIAWLLHAEDHHPELVVGYDRVDTRFDTHSVGGLSDNDFICAAKCDALYAARPKATAA